MVSMSTVWDRTAEVIQGRAGMLAAVAGALGFLPAVVQAALVSFANPGAGVQSAAAVATAGGLTAIVSLLVGVAAVWNNLALVAATSDPAIQSTGSAITAGGRRLPPALGLTLLLGLLAMVLFVPVIVLLMSSGVDVAALARGETAGAMAGGSVGGGAMLGLSFYVLLLLAIGLWLAARLFVFVPVLVNERLGFGSFARSFQLTRGSTWRIIGVTLLFVLVAGVASAAAQAVIGLIARLALGANGAAGARFVAAVAGAGVSAAFAVVYATFTAQFYRTVTGREAAEAFG